MPDDPYAQYQQPTSNGSSGGDDPYSKYQGSLDAPAPVDLSALTNNPVADFARGAWNTTGAGVVNLAKIAGSAVTGNVNPAIDAVHGAWDAQADQFRKSKEAFKSGSPIEGAGYAAAGVLPLIGPAAAHAGELIGSGDTATGMGEAAGLLAPFAAHAAKAGVAKVSAPIQKSLREGAKTDYARAFAPTTKHNKALTKTVVEGRPGIPGQLPATPGMIERGVTAWSRGGLQDKITTMVDDLGSKIDEAQAKIPYGSKKLPLDDITKSIDAGLNKRFTIQTPEMAKPPVVEAQPNLMGTPKQPPQQAEPLRPLPEMSPDELDSVITKQRSADSSLLSQLFGEEGAKRYSNLERKANGSSAGADTAADQLAQMEEGLSKEQQNKLFGIDQPEQYDVTAAKSMRSALGRLDPTSPEALGESMKWAMSRFDPANPLADPEAYAQLRHGTQLAQENGYNTADVTRSALKGAAGRFKDPEDAAFMLSKLKNKPKPQPNAAPSKGNLMSQPTPTPEPAKPLSAGPDADRGLAVGRKLKMAIAAAAEQDPKTGKMVVDYQLLRTFKQNWDASIAESGGFANKDFVNNAKMGAYKAASNGIRNQLNEATPDIAKINREFHFWKNAQDVIDATVDRTKGQSTPLGQQLFTGAGAAAGLASGGATKAVEMALAMKNVRKLTTSTAWNTFGAVAKDRLANALAMGDGKTANAILASAVTQSDTSDRRSSAALPQPPQ